MSKTVKDTLKEIVNIEANKLKEMTPPAKYYSTHRKDADMDFLNTFIRIMDNTNILLFLTCGDKINGMMMLYGEPKIVTELGPK